MHICESIYTRFLAESSVTSYTITSKSVSQGETSNEHKTSNGNTNGIDGEYCCRFYSSPNSLFRQGLLDLLLHACIYDRFIDWDLTRMSSLSHTGVTSLDIFQISTPPPIKLLPNQINTGRESFVLRYTGSCWHGEWSWWHCCSMKCVR